jgi:hypothetical protein
MIPKVLRGLPRRLEAAWHNRRIAGIVDTAPALADASGPLYAGMTCHGDAKAWLVAVKSISGLVGPGGFGVLDDGSLTAEDTAMLVAHLPGLRLFRIADVDTQGCPRGGMWERLMVVLDLAAERYVVQVDSDLVAVGALDEVAEAVRANRSFSLSGEPGVAVRSLAEASAAARSQTYPHIQHDVERVLEEMPGAAGSRYVRGCAGFTGFPAGSDRAPALAFSGFMQARFGVRWQSWGTEQITSNFVVANGNDPLALPWERYPAFLGAAQDVSLARLVHFIGPARFDGGVYGRKSLEAIDWLCGERG